MKKNLLKLLAVLAAVLVLPLSCKKPAPTPEPEPEPEPDVPAKVESNLTIAPSGGEATIDFRATDAWTVEKDENYKWISYSPASGAAGEKLTITFTADANDSGRERSAVFYVMQGKNTLCEIFISQAKMAIPIGAGDYEFLKAIVDGQMLGADTPTVDDWYSFDADNFSAPGINLVNKDGLWYVSSIDGAPLTDFPEKMDLPELEVIYLQNQVGLAGKMLPKEWNTPKLLDIRLSHTQMTGTIPAGLAASPILNQLYFDDTDFYGALPHNWASTVLEVALVGSINNANSPIEEPWTDNQCPYLGYMVPASLDVILNSNRVAQTDKTQMKVGGVREGHWIGFEEGWGQERYEYFDPAAVVGDKTVWSDWRLLIGQAEKDPDVWAWYFSNMGYTDFRISIPKKMLVWDQSVADAFTEAAKIAHDTKGTIDMTKFGKEVEVTPDDDIDKGNVIDVDPGFWN